MSHDQLFKDLLSAVETYLELDAVDEATLRATLNAEGEAIMEATELTWADKILLRGREQRLEQGLEQGALEARRQVLRRFSSVPPDLERRIAAATAETLDQILDQVVTAANLEELQRE